LRLGARRLEVLKAAYDGNGVASPEQIAAALARTALTTSLSDALVDADLLIEAIPERLDIKRAFYTQLQAVAPVKTIFASNSSTMVSRLANWPSTPGAPSGFCIYISPLRFGGTISLRSWRIRTPIRRCSRHSSRSPDRWAWCRYP
jgi:hypothetical protein